MTHDTLHTITTMIKKTSQSASAHISTSRRPAPRHDQPIPPHFHPTHNRSTYIAHARRFNQGTRCTHIHSTPHSPCMTQTAPTRTPTRSTGPPPPGRGARSHVREQHPILQPEGIGFPRENALRLGNASRVQSDCRARIICPVQPRDRRCLSAAAAALAGAARPLTKSH